MSGMLEELRAMLHSIEDARAIVVCHPNDEASVRLAVEAIAVVAPHIEINQWARPGEVLVFPDPSAPRGIVP